MDFRIVAEPPAALFLSEFCKPPKPLEPTKFQFEAAADGVSKDEQFVSVMSIERDPVVCNLTMRTLSSRTSTRSEKLSGPNLSHAILAIPALEALMD